MSPKDEPLDIANALLTAYAVQIRDFVDVAKRFCQAVEARRTSTQVGFLQAIEAPLAELYVRAMALPDDELSYSADDDDEPGEDEVETPAQETGASPDWIHAAAARLRKEEEDAFPLLATSYVDVSQRLEIANDIGGLLGPLDIYNEVFDPYGEAEAIPATLGDDLTSIYGALKTYLPMFESGDTPAMREALWQWRFGFDGHWGEHLTGALRSIHALLRDKRSGWSDDEWDNGRLIPFEIE
jgi:hypothetical protein